MSLPPGPWLAEKNRQQQVRLCQQLDLPSDVPSQLQSLEASVEGGGGGRGEAEEMEILAISWETTSHENSITFPQMPSRGHSDVNDEVIM